jgi:sterol desaturase/sphingolipid hydroxylase (fatty acid hydroxylase superfamily)
VLLAFTAVLLNSLVAVIGWLLWKAGWIRLTHPAWWRSVIDVVIFLGAMDFGMYVFHRLAHHPWVFRLIHARHHTHESVNAISLFVLSPFEVLGFGGLMTAVMTLVPLSGAAVLIYLVFGTLGHAGVEPFPESWRLRLLLREIGSSSFHAGHHRTPTNNFGFYTLICDRLFGTLERPNHPSFRP